MRNLLRSLRASAGSASAAVIATVPAAERPTIVAGRWLSRRSRLFATLYWAMHSDLVERLQRRGRSLRLMRLHGVDVLVDVADHTGHLHYFEGEAYEPEVARTIVDRLHPGDAFLDVGANVGFFSVLAAKVVGPTGTVIAFEPDPTVRVRLQRMIDANGLGGIVETVHAAVGAREGQATLHLSTASVVSTLDPSRAPLDFVYQQTAEVTIHSLDEWLSHHPLLNGRVRIVKIDVEGTEDDVIRGARALLTGPSRPAVICETIEQSGADRFLLEHGYRRSRLHAYGDVGAYLYDPA